MANAIASSAVMAQGWFTSRSGNEVANNAFSGKPAYSSSLVYRAILQAALTVSLMDSTDKSVVLAEPLRWPK